METVMMLEHMGFAAVIVGFWMAAIWLMVSEERRRAKRWCREHGLRLGVFEYGEGRGDFWYVGIDGKGNRWLVPNGEGSESVECVREGSDGGIEFYEPEEAKRFVLTWGVVLAIAKVVLAEVAKRAIVRMAEILLERLKEEWGVRGVATADKVREMAEELRKGCRSGESVEGEEAEVAERVVEAIVSVAREKCMSSVEGKSGDEVYETFLSGVKGVERKRDAEGDREGDELKEEIRQEPGGNGGRIEPVRDAEREEHEKRKDEEERAAAKEGIGKSVEEFVDGYEERGW